jgi:hypothetical protein
MLKEPFNGKKRAILNAPRAHSPELCSGVSELTNIKFPTHRDYPMLASGSLNIANKLFIELLNFSI